MQPLVEPIERSPVQCAAAEQTLLIADLPLCLRCVPAHATHQDELHRWFGWFAVPPRQDAIVLTLSFETDRLLPKAEDDPQAPCTATCLDGTYHWRWEDGTTAWYDPARRVGQWQAAQLALGRLRHFLLQVCLSHLIDQGGLVIHAGALRTSYGGWLFVGTSGAGKTTLLRDAQPCDAVADDVAVVRHVNGDWWIDRGPWMANFRWAAGAPARTPLVAGAILDRGPIEARAPLAPPQAVAALRRCLVGPPVPPSEDPERWAALTATVAALGVAMPWYRMSYDRSRGTPWRLLDAPSDEQTTAEGR